MTPNLIRVSGSDRLVYSIHVSRQDMERVGFDLTDFEPSCPIVITVAAEELGSRCYLCGVLWSEHKDQPHLFQEEI